MSQQVTGRVGHDGVGRGPHGQGLYGEGHGMPGRHVVPAPRRAPVAPHPAPHPVAHAPQAWAAAPLVPVATVASPAPGSSAASRSIVVVALTVVALAVLTLVGVLLYPRIAASGAVVTAAPVPASVPTTVVVPAPASSGSSSGAYSCGSANGYAIEVQNGNVPCSSARWVTTMWTTDGTTPMSGTGPAGTPYSWSCASATATAEVGSCVSKMGSTFTISR